MTQLPTGRSSIHPGIMMTMLPVLLVNTAFILQAVVFDWRLSTLVWLYWLEAMLLLVIATFIRKKTGSIIILLIMAFYGIFLMSLTFPSDSASYTVNGVSVEAGEFTILSDVQWDIVWLNLGGIIFAYILSRLIGRDLSYFDVSRAARRIIPLHLTIVLALAVSWPLILFLALRTTFDISAEYALAKIKHSQR